MLGLNPDCFRKAFCALELDGAREKEPCATGEHGLRPRFASRTGFKASPSGRQMEVSIMNGRNLSRTLALAVSVVLVGMFAFSGSAFAKYRPGCEAPPCGGPGEETAAQNLSVPAILVGSLGTLVCGAT